MSGFSETWLALREPADHAARHSGLTGILVDWARCRGHLSILDLGSGTGSNMRYLAPRLGIDQRWLMIDHDTRLLARLPGALREWADASGYSIIDDAGGLRIQADGCRLGVQWSRADLSRLLHAGLPSDVNLVTASALLDLTSEDWIRRLAECCAARGCAALFALSYDGCIQWRPRLPGDAVVTGLLNGHQRRDKGLGPALGPEAADRAVDCLSSVGLSVRAARSDWTLGPGASDLQEALTRGWLEAARDMDPSASDLLEAWLEARLEHLGQGNSWLSVGHQDLLALPEDL